jgi:RHS repeat-associated protein
VHLGIVSKDQRFYSSQWGRFMSSDPCKAGGGLADPGSWNKYAYTRGDPINRIDPRGLEDQEVPRDPTVWCPYNDRYEPQSLCDLGNTPNGPVTSAPPQGGNNEPPCPPIPLHPGSADVRENVRIAEAKSIDFFNNFDEA